EQGEGLARPQMTAKALERVREIIEHVFVREAHDDDAQCFARARAFLVARACHFMHTAVDFDDELRARAVEVGDVPDDDVLATEPNAQTRRASVVFSSRAARATEAVAQPSSSHALFIGTRPKKVAGRARPS